MDLANCAGMHPAGAGLVAATTGIWVDSVQTIWLTLVYHTMP